VGNRSRRARPVPGRRGVGRGGTHIPAHLVRPVRPVWACALQVLAGRSADRERSGEVCVPRPSTLRCTRGLRRVGQPDPFPRGVRIVLNPTSTPRGVASPLSRRRVGAVAQLSVPGPSVAVTRTLATCFGASRGFWAKSTMPSALPRSTGFLCPECPDPSRSKATSAAGRRLSDCAVCYPATSRRAAVRTRRFWLFRESAVGHDSPSGI